MKEVLLTSQAARGNRKALEKLVRLYYEKIYNYIGYRVQDFSAAEDLTQDVFVKLTRHIHSYVPTASFSAFLYRIAHNTVVDYYRTTKHTETIPETLQAADPLPAGRGQDGRRADVGKAFGRAAGMHHPVLSAGLDLPGDLSGLGDTRFRQPNPACSAGLAACKKIMEENS